MAAAFIPETPGAEHHHLGRVDPGHAAHQHAPAAAVTLQVVRADLGRHPAGDLGHGCQQRQRPVGRLHRLVGDRGDARAQQGLGAGAGGGEMQVGEQHLALAQPGVLLRDRLLHLQDELPGLPHLVGPGQDRCPGGGEVGVGDGRADARAGLDEDLVARADKLVHTRWRDRDPVLVVLDLFGDAHLHGCTSLLALPVPAAPLPLGPGPGGYRGRQSAPGQRGLPGRRETALPGGIRGQDTHCGNTIVQVTCEEEADHRTQRHPPHQQMGLLVAGNVTSTARFGNPGQVTGEDIPAAVRW